MKRKKPVGFAPDGSHGYGLTEDHEFALHDLARTMLFLGNVIERPVCQSDPDIETADLAALLRSLGRATQNIADGAVNATVVPWEFKARVEA